jgi:transposase
MLIPMKDIHLELEKWKSKYQNTESARRKLEDKNIELQALVKYYEEQYRLSQQKRYGSSSERADCAAQMLLIFDEAENEASPKEPEPTVEEITYTRRKRVGKREDDLSGLPVETIEHTLPEEARVCPQCGDSMHVMGHETRRELEIIPAQVRVLEHVREVCSCRRCEREGTRTPIVKAPMPKPVIEGSIASPSFVAHIMTQKFRNAMPLYRQEQSFLSEGFFLSRQTMANWLLRSSADWLEPQYGLMREKLWLFATSRG